MKRINETFKDNRILIPETAINLPTSGAEILEISFKTEAETQGKTGDCYIVDGIIHPFDPEACGIRFRIGLPASWNGKAVQLGGGGLDGVVPDVTNIFPTGGAGINAPSPLKKGYVVFGSDITQFSEV